MLKKLQEIFFEPKMAFLIFTVFVFVYLVSLDEEGAFQKKFLNFGPSKDTKFFNMTLDSWDKVILVYVIGFCSSLLTSFYGTVSNDFIHQYIWNPAYTKTIQVSKLWTSLIVTIEPLLFWILGILNFFINLIMELQYIIPKFLGAIMIDIPYSLYKVNQKKYIK